MPHNESFLSNLLDKTKPFISISNASHNDAFQVCYKNNRTVGSLGMWIGDNPLDFVLPITLCQIILSFMVSRVLYFLLRPLQTPRFICCVLVSFNLSIHKLKCYVNVHYFLIYFFSILNIRVS
jgi:hypothetical protein